MTLRTTQGFATWLRSLRDASSEYPIARRRGLRVQAMLRQLTTIDPGWLDHHPQIDRLIEARSHRLWRMRHEHDEQVQVRLIVWVAPTGDVWIVYAGDKAGQEDTWYTRAAQVSEREVDRIIRRAKGE